jgi:hypothetical protein
MFAAERNWLGSLRAVSGFDRTTDDTRYAVREKDATYASL